jgi:hypothetical protein
LYRHSAAAVGGAPSDLARTMNRMTSSFRGLH